MDTQTEVPTRVGPVPVRTVGDGPAVLAVHGALVDGRLWDGVAQRLAPHARVVVPDLPLGAHRRAVPDRSRLTPTELAGALVDVLDGLDVLPRQVGQARDRGSVPDRGVGPVMVVLVQPGRQGLAAG